MDSVLQIIEVLLMGLVPEQEQKSWRQHVNIVRFLEKRSFERRQDLKQLTRKIVRWKKMNAGLYRAPGVQPVLSQLRGVRALGGPDPVPRPPWLR